MDYRRYFEQAVSYDTYNENFQKELAIGEQSQFAAYLPQNWQRQSRIDRKLNVQEDALAALQQIKIPLHWLVITEHWCGDASQINPVINKMAVASNGKIDLRFIYRDQNEELIDAHLTDGRSRSIPLLLQLDQDFNFMDSYGPRPADAQTLVKSLLAKNEDYNIPLHIWYAKDKQKTILSDLTQIIQ